MVLHMIVDPFYLTIVDLSMCQLCVMLFHLYDFGCWICVDLGVLDVGFWSLDFESWDLEFLKFRFCNDTAQVSLWLCKSATVQNFFNRVADGKDTAHHFPKVYLKHINHRHSAFHPRPFHPHPGKLTKLRIQTSKSQGFLKYEGSDIISPKST